jgi:hypothetical protein
MNIRLLLNAIRNSMTALGLAGTIGYFAGSKLFADFLGAMVVGGTVTAFYYIEMYFRELRLKKGWY